MASTPTPVPPTDPSKAVPPTGAVARGSEKAPAAPDQVPDQTAPDAEGAAVAHLGFMQQPWVQNLLPMATSLVLHIGLFVVGFIGFKTVEAVYNKVVEEQVIIPDATLATDGPPGGVVNPGALGDPTRRAEQNIDETVTQSDSWASKKGEALQASLAGAAGDTTGEAVIGLGGGTFGAKGGKSFGVGTGDGAGSLAPFGTPGGGGGIGPKAPFAGIGGNARKIVYVCDASGTMLDVFSALRDQLKRSVDTLVPLQWFNVVFFSDENVMVYNKGGLVVASPDNKAKLYDWIDGVSARGSTQPIPAIQQAFANKPELMYVLTDGFDQVNDLESIYREFEKLNPDRKVKVNCILLTTKDKKLEDKDVAQLHDLLKRIAERNGGILKVVDRDKF